MAGMSSDYFSKRSGAYQQYRPRYPQQLFAYFFQQVGRDACVWDCATGNGQAAVGLNRYAGCVVATDSSSSQLGQAISACKVHYVQANAESVPLADDSVDFITVAQALHWFDFDQFYNEARRVLKSRGFIAAWTYSFLPVLEQLGTNLGSVIRSFYHEVLGPYWPTERRWVDEHYRSIPFPFNEITTPIFTMELEWCLADVLGYIESWSAVQRYKEHMGCDPMPLLATDLAVAWGSATSFRRMNWPLGLRFGRVD